MEISFRTTKLEKQLLTERGLAKLGKVRAKKIKVRITELRAASSLYDFWPPLSPPSRCHELSGEYDGCLAMDLDHPYRLILIPNHNPIPEKDDGGLDWTRVTHILIDEIVDYHD